MAASEENDCEDELPKARAYYDAEIAISFKSCKNTAISCKFIDTAVPVARHIIEPHLRARTYFDQIATTARAKQVHVDGIDFLLSIGQLAALLRFKNAMLRPSDTRSVVGLLCFEESSPRSSLCLTAPVYPGHDIDRMCDEFVAALGVEESMRPRFRSGPVLAPLFDFIATFYPRGCVMCIYHLSALIVKATLCYDSLCIQAPAEYTDRDSVASDVMCDVICGYAFSNARPSKKHRLMHLFQLAMLLEARFVSSCVARSEEIKARLTLKMYKKKIALKCEHANAHKCLHDAISSYMEYDVGRVVPWVHVTAHIATYMFSVIGSDIIGDFIDPPKRNSTGHCLLTEASTGRVIYHL